MRALASLLTRLRPRPAAREQNPKKLTGFFDEILLQLFESGAISYRPDESVRSESAREPCAGIDDFARKARRLTTLAAQLGYDPARVSLRAQPPDCDYLDQSFRAEGEAFPDGRIEVYYDPAMSEARMGCCLAHEIQHAKYFKVRDAFRAEAEDGPLHRRFAAFTPERLAAQRGVSDYSNEHWDAWSGAASPRLFSDELGEGGAEPISESVAEVAKALYNWGRDARVNAVWLALKAAIDEEYEKLR